MQKSKQKLDLNISREVTQRIISYFPTLLSVGESWDKIDNVKDLASAGSVALSDRSCDFGAQEFSMIYQRLNFLSKYVDENTDAPEVRRTRAIVKWLAVERRNSKTNSRLFSSDPLFVLHARNGDRIAGWQLFRKAGTFIQRVIGKRPPIDILERGGFSGGATTSRKRGPETLVSKFVGSIDVTPSCQHLWKEVVSKYDTWTFYDPLMNHPRVVKGNVLFTVPKTAIIDRVACKEPDGNIFCQKAVGDFIRRRLMTRGGIDLNDQSINRELARKASISRSVATIDLSSASDSISMSLVRALLPLEWYELLDSIRSPKTFIDGASHVNEMFSSMGNGFTFELESLLFWAIARAVAYYSRVSGEISVYGDDIILPSRIATTFTQVLSWCGFKTNVDKTFVSGSFRESCGGHYIAGLDVTPFFLRRPIKTVSDLILFLNQYRAWLIRTELDTYGLRDWSDRNKFVSFWYELARSVPKPLWGGYELTSRTQLVSKGPQQCELLEITRSSLGLERRYQVGMYLSRLCVLNKRDFHHEDILRPLTLTGRGIEDIDERATGFSGLPTNSGRFVMRRCKVEPAVFGAVRPLFCSEQ
jgi:hypothetical protein